MQPFPNTGSKFIDKLGKIVTPWIQYLQQFTQSPPNFKHLTVTASPFAYTAKEPGYVILSGGTIGALTLTRGTDVINLTGQIIIPVSINDIVAVTYSVLPTIRFVPIYGANVG